MKSGQGDTWHRTVRVSCNQIFLDPASRHEEQRPYWRVANSCNMEGESDDSACIFWQGCYTSALSFQMRSKLSNIKAFEAEGSYRRVQSFESRCHGGQSGRYLKKTELPRRDKAAFEHHRSLEKQSLC